MAENTVVIKDAVKPVCNDPVLSSHPERNNYEIERNDYEMTE